MMGGEKTGKIVLDTRIYSKASIFRTCYKFTDRAYIFLAYYKNEPKSIIVSINVKNRHKEIKKIVQEFKNELLDQNIREKLENEFGPIRNLIVAQAFSEGNLLNSGLIDSSKINEIK